MEILGTVLNTYGEEVCLELSKEIIPFFGATL